MSSYYHASDKTNMKILPVLINKQFKKKNNKRRTNDSTLIQLTS